MSTSPQFSTEINKDETIKALLIAGGLHADMFTVQNGKITAVKGKKGAVDRVVKRARVYLGVRAEAGGL